MHVERLLQINIATVVALSAFMLGVGQQEVILPLATLVAAMLSVWLTDVTGNLVLPRIVARLAPLVALLISLPAALYLERYSLIAAVGRFLVYLQIIHLFHKKDLRIYGLLLRLTLLVVVVAGLLRQDLFFGAMLVVYLFTALSALLLLFLHGERPDFETSGRPASACPAPAGQSGGGRWPLAAQRATVSCAAGGWIPVQGAMFPRLLTMGIVVLGISILVFFTVPRVGRGAWRGGRGSMLSMVGFSDKVTLGELGKIIEDPAEVLRMSLFDPATGKPYPVRGEVYLRGAVLTYYRQGEWQPSPVPVFRWGPLKKVLSAMPGEGVVRQKIVIEPMDRPELFCVWPCVLPPPANVEFDDRSERLLRPAELIQQRFPYELDTTAFEEGLLAPVVPRLGWANLGDLTQMPTENGRGTVPSLGALAEQWVNESGVPAGERYGRARLLERQLRDSGQFRYSLEGQARDLALDPIEDFITNNPRGHCEYFATALVLMLRSQAIPARLVVGYRSDEWNQVGEPFLQVRQLHAHTWVEAYLERDEIPEESRSGWPGRWLAGGWLRLDPTAAGGESARDSWLIRPSKYLDWLNFAWNNYIMEMDRSRQRQAIYQPVADLLREAALALTDPNWWRRTLARLADALGLRRWYQPGTRWFEWRAFLAVVFGGVVLMAVLGLVTNRRLRRWLASVGSRGDLARRGDQVRVEFYRRLEALLARSGLSRPPCQTQREFGRAAGLSLAGRLGDEQLAPLPLLVAEAFYRVRFGRARLDSSQAEAVELALARLERAIGQLGRGTSAARRRQRV